MASRTDCRAAIPGLSATHHYSYPALGLRLYRGRRTRPRRHRETRHVWCAAVGRRGEDMARTSDWTRRSLLAAAPAMAALGAFPLRAQAKGDFKIGIIGSMSGPAA